MRIISIDETRLAEAAEYTSRVSGENYNKIHKGFKKRIQAPSDEVLLCIEEDRILGVSSICVDNEGKYIELTSGVHTEENFQTIAEAFFKYFKEKFSGYHFDVVYKEKNTKGIDFIESIGAECVLRDKGMKLTRNDYKPLKLGKEIVPISEQYYKAFCRLHDEEHPDVYWTGERIINALDKFEVIVAIHCGDLIGSIVSELNSENKKYISFLEVEKNYRRQGYARCLIEKSVDIAYANDKIDEVFLNVEVENEAAINLYQSIGFKVYDASNTYSIDSL